MSNLLRLFALLGSNDRRFNWARKAIKRRFEKTKIDLIEKRNPEWNNLLSEVQDLMTV